MQTDALYELVEKYGLSFNELNLDLNFENDFDFEKAIGSQLKVRIEKMTSNVTWMIDENGKFNLDIYEEQSAKRFVYQSTCQLSKLLVLLAVHNKKFSSEIRDYKKELKDFTCPIHSDLTKIDITLYISFNSGEMYPNLTVEGMLLLISLLFHCREWKVDNKYLDFLSSFGEIRTWQNRALLSWASHGRKSIIEAATGSGKTLLGLLCILEAISENRPVVVVTHRKLLLDQWIEDSFKESNNASVSPFRHYQIDRSGSFNLFSMHGKSHYAGWNGQGPNILVALVQSLVSKSEKHPEKRMRPLIVIDEVHHYASETWSNILIDNYQEAIGLTAYLGSDGPNAYKLFRFFNQTITFNYSYPAAVEDNVVAKYKVITIACQSNIHDKLKFRKAADRLQLAKNDLFGWKRKLKTSSTLDEEVDQIIRLNEDELGHAQKYKSSLKDYFEVLAKADKLAGIKAIQQLLRQTGRTLIFCDTKQVMTEVNDLLLNLKVRSIEMHGEDVLFDRPTILNTKLAPVDERKRELDAVCAPKILDEGVDIPYSRIAVFMGTHKPSKTVVTQRMGRVLRKKGDTGWNAVLVNLVIKGEIDDPSASKLHYSKSENSITDILTQGLGEDSISVFDAENHQGIGDCLSEWIQTENF
ncbi:MAG: hypothetical protein RLZZ330_4 [Actinomycetota bacterium]|jgi:superfamily II DNA or RNA helicase